MTSKKYLISNIKINNNEQFQMRLPLVFAEYGQLSQFYVRTHAMNHCAVTYDIKEIDRFSYTTSNEEQQPYNIDLTDASYNDYIEVTVMPLPITGCCMHVSDDEIATSDTLEQVVYEKLLFLLKADFLITHN